MTDDQRAAIRARLEALPQSTAPLDWDYQDYHERVVGQHGFSINHMMDPEVGEFIAHAPADIETLLTRVETLESVLRAIATELDSARISCELAVCWITPIVC